MIFLRRGIEDSPTEDFSSAIAPRPRPHVAVENASSTVLRRCGFERAGEVIDPEDGLVWRWQRPTMVSSSINP
jgi:hypothetical protein